MNILYIDKVFNIDEIRPLEQVVFAEELPKLKHKIIILLKKNNLCINSSNKQDIKVYYYSNNIINQIISIYKLIKSGIIKYIIIRNIIYISYIALIYKYIFKIKVIYIRPFPSEEFNIFSAYRGFSRNKILSLIKNKIRLILILFIMKRSDLVIAQSKQFKKYLKTKYNIYKNVISIPMGYSFNWENNNKNKDIIYKKYNINNNYKIICYFGSMDKMRNIEICFEIFEIILKKIENVILILSGGNNDDIKRLKNNPLYKLNSNKIIFTGMLKREELFDIISISDVTISPIPPIECYKISSPTKVVESIGMGIPVVGNKEIQDQYEVISESGCGICIDYNAKSFANAIIQVIENGNKDNYYRKGRDYIKVRRNYSIFAKEIESILINL